MLWEHEVAGSIPATPTTYSAGGDSASTASAAIEPSRAPLKDSATAPDSAIGTTVTTCTSTASARAWSRGIPSATPVAVAASSNVPT